VIFIANGDAIAQSAIAAMSEARAADGLLVSPVSAWEIGLLSRPDRPATIRFLPDPKTWFARFLAAPGVRETSLTPDIAIDSSHLPGPLHGDPADRLLIATARHLGVPIVTRDRHILDYAAHGHVRVVAC
jgi:PIN domain nuclease of toxin-antitoxin system